MDAVEPRNQDPMATPPLLPRMEAGLNPWKAALIVLGLGSAFVLGATAQRDFDIMHTKYGDKVSTNKIHITTKHDRIRDAFIKGCLPLYRPEGIEKWINEAEESSKNGKQTFGEALISQLDVLCAMTTMCAISPTEEQRQELNKKYNAVDSIRKTIIYIENGNDERDNAALSRIKHLQSNRNTD